MASNHGKKSVLSKRRQPTLNGSVPAKKRRRVRWVVGPQIGRGGHTVDPPNKRGRQK